LLPDDEKNEIRRKKKENARVAMLWFWEKQSL